MQVESEAKASQNRGSTKETTRVGAKRTKISPKEISELAEKNFLRKKRLSSILFSKNREKRQFVLIHISAETSFSTQQGVKKAFIEAGLSVLALGHISLILNGKTIELAVDVKYINKVKEICRYFKLIIYRTFYVTSSTENEYESFILG